MSLLGARHSVALFSYSLGPSASLAVRKNMSATEWRAPSKDQPNRLIEYASTGRLVDRPASISAVSRDSTGAKV
jgi:hypothetical protein